MTNLEKYKNAFVESFDLDVKEVENASQETVEIWDSIGMMSLIAVIEDGFYLFPNFSIFIRFMHCRILVIKRAFGQS